MMTFPIQIVTPDGLIFDGQAERLFCRTIAGDVCILARHCDYMTALGMGEARLTLEDGTVRRAACIGGLLAVTKGAARLVATVAAPAQEDRVLDVCAAPGGKSFAMAMDRRDRGQILSCDVHPHKLKLIDSGAQRLGITSIRTALADAREEHAAWLEQADVVVADVPCSGLGIIRKKPDIRYKNPRDLAQLPAIQGDILENACRYVCPGGVLVYSTCTVLPEENQEIIHVFLSRHPEFRRETFTLPGPVGLCDGEATLWPQRLGTDGFYICRMRRKA